MGDGIERIQEKIQAFKRKYYLNLLVRGLLLTLSILFFYFLIAALLEYTLWFGPWMRFLIFLSFFICLLAAVQPAGARRFAGAVLGISRLASL
jgi:cobalamin biosynthesis protein CobD/CbiB